LKYLFTILIYCCVTKFGVAQKIATIPFEQLYGGVILLKAQIDNKKDTLNFILDTGSSHISLDSTTASLLQITTISSEHYINGIGGIKKVREVKDLDLKIGNLKVPHIDFNINDYSVLTESSGIRIDGIIGYAFISKYILNVNFDSSLINVYPIGKYKYPKRGFVLKYNLDYLPSTILDTKENKKFKLPYYIDCGAGLSLLFAEKFVQDSNIYNNSKNISIVQIEGMGGKTTTKIATTKEVKIGPYKFRNVPTFIYNDSFDVLKYPTVVGLIGNELLRRFNWVLNYSEGEMYIQPNTFYNDPFDYSYTGLSIYLVDGFMEIVDIVPNSPGAIAGFKPGDIIFSVDNTISTSLKQTKDLFQVNNRRKVKVLILREKKLLEINIKIKSIL
jgi:predicted aspartyl protease